MPRLYKNNKCSGRALPGLPFFVSVIGSDGSLTDYGGGLERKQALLELEKVFKFIK